MFEKYIMRNNYRWMVLMLTFFIFMFFVIMDGASAAPIIMKVGYQMGGTPEHPHYHVGRYLQKRVEELTGDRVKVQLYPQSQLGGDREIMEGTMNGTIEMGWLDTAIIVSVVPETGVLNLPGLFKDLDHPIRVLDGKVGKLLEDKCLAKGMRMAGWSFSGIRHIFTVKKPIYKLEDLKGLKIRVMETPIYIEMMKAWNAVATPVAWPEVYMALSQGVVEGVDSTVPASLDMKHFESLRYVALTYNTVAIRALVISEKWWQSLPPDIQAAISKATKETAQILNKKIFEAEDIAAETVKKKYGVIFTTPDLKPFRDAVRAAYPKFEKLVGGREIIDLVLSIE